MPDFIACSRIEGEQPTIRGAAKYAAVFKSDSPIGGEWLIADSRIDMPPAHSALSGA
jgi:hypothetical protein